ncbi:MAG: acyltransferase family protein [Archangium sp.]|nr:acyltransferase family protein [Archangium sp.]
MSEPELPHRKDIDGLRGVAIGAVVLFHLFPSALPGGFVGVDIFFVISGFLITRQILQALGKEQFTFADFYARRARRLLPALLVVLLAASVAGFDVLLRGEWEQLARHMLGGLTWTTNFILVGEGGYFDRPAHFKPLHHLWSLGVEEQFYLVWPALLWWTRKWSTRSRLAALVALGVGSFACNLSLTLERPSAAFYLPVGRLWQFALGGLAAAVPAPRRFSAALGLAGAVLVGGGVAFASAVGYPGMMAVLPTAGALALIAAGPTAGVNRALAGRPLVALGLVSYPLYLWHWPVEVFARLTSGPVYWGIDDSPALSGSLSLAVLAVSLFLSALTVRFVERPVRFERRVSVRVLVAASVVLGCGAGAAWAGWVGPRSDAGPLERLEAARARTWKPRQLDEHQWNGLRFWSNAGADAAVLFAGDSNMAQYAPGLEARLARGEARSFALLTSGGCAPFVAIDVPGCPAFFEGVRTFSARPTVDTVVLAANWALYFDNPRFSVGGHQLSVGEPRTEAALRAFEGWLREVRKTRRVVLVLNIPTSPALDPARRSWLRGVTIDPAPLPRAGLEAALGPVAGRLREIARAAGVEVIDPFELLCDAQQCPLFTSEGLPIYRDASHVTTAWAERHFSAFDALITEAPR